MSALCQSLRLVPAKTLGHDRASQATAMLYLDWSGRFSRVRVSIALPVGLRNFNADLPGR